MLTHLSHEIRTPLNAMLALSQLLRDGLAGSLNPEQQRYIDVIERNGQNVIRLVNDMLDFSRMQSGHLTLQLISLDLGDQLRAAGAALAPLALAKNLGFVVQASDDLPLVRCDPERVRQILTNLIANAIKFTKQGKVTLSARLASDVVAVQVSDTGMGISESARPRLFEPYYQVAASGEDGAGATGGTGLGLAIADQLVRLMGGELSVDSTLGVGSSFTFTLPVAERQSQRAGDLCNDGAVPPAPRYQDDLHGPNTAGR